MSLLSDTTLSQLLTGRYPPQCDFSKCRCLTRCESIGEFSRLTGSSEWCNMSCLRYPSLCPPEKCSCQ